MRTFLALKRDDSWCLQYSMTAFLSDLAEEAEEQVQPIVVETKSILAVRELMNIDETLISSLLDQIKNGPFSALHSGNSVSSYEMGIEPTSYNFFEPMHRKEFPGNWRWPALTASTKFSVLDHHFPSREQLELELLSNKIPFSGVIELLDLLGIPLSPFQGGNSSLKSIWLISPPVIILEKISCQRGAQK